MVLVLFIAMAVAPAFASGSSMLDGVSDEELLEEINRRLSEGLDDSEDSDTSFMAKATDKLSTRSGPSIDYTKTGTYNVIDESVRIISRFDDHDGVC